MSKVVIGVTAYDIASRFIGQREMRGRLDNPQIMAMLRLDARWPQHDETPWCSAFVNYVAWLLGLPRSERLNARSWLDVGRSIEPDMVEGGFDVVVLSRGSNPAHGHVGFFHGWRASEQLEHMVVVLGGNQGDEVSVKAYSQSRILSIQRLIG